MNDGFRLDGPSVETVEDMAQVFAQVQRCYSSNDIVDGVVVRYRFRRMRISGKLKPLMTLIGLVLCPSACRQESASRSNDTVNVSQPPPASTTESPTSPSTWDARIGAVFAVPGPSSTAAYLVFPSYTGDVSLDTVHFDLKTPAGTTLQLLRDGRQVAVAQVAALTQERVDDCTTWPLAQLAPTSETTLPNAWTIGVDPNLTTLAIDSLEGLTSKDSIRITVALARLASVLPGDTAAAFRGRPFVVRHASPFADGANSLILAEIVRSVSQEAMPLQEHLLLIAQADSSDRAGYRWQYFERTIGLEDAAETTELLAVVRTGTGELLAIVSRDLGDGAKYSLIERSANGGWRLRWSSAYAGC